MPPRRKRARQESTPGDPDESGQQTQDSPAPSATPAAAQGTEDEDAKRKREEAFNTKWKVAIRTDEEVLAEQMKTWYSDAYNHFTLPPIIIYEDGQVKYRWFCKRHPSQHCTRVRTDTSTTNLNKHIDRCEPHVPKGNTSIADYAAGSMYNKAEFRYLTTVWIARCHCPFAIVEDEPLLDMFKMLYAPVEVPLASTVLRDVKEVFTLSKTEVGAFLQRQKSAVHIAFDGWTTPNVISFLGVVVSFEQKGAIVSFLLDFIRLHKSHKGAYLAQEMHTCLESYGIADKIFGQAADNASNNDTMIEALGNRLSGPAGPHTRIRCLCHVLNLCVKAILQPFSKKKKASASQSAPETEGDASDDDDDSDDPVEDAAPTGTDGEEPDDKADDEYELDKAREASDQAEIADIVAESESAALLPEHERLFAQKTLAKVNALTKKIFHSPILRQDLADLCKKHNLKPLGVVRPVPTRWNSVAMTSKRAIYLEAPLRELVGKACHNVARGPRLLRFKLSDAEWAILKQLDQILAYFLEATQRMSERGRPLLHEVIPMIDLIHGMLKTASDDRALKPAVRVAASLGRAVLNRYYSKTDDSIMYRCAMIMHPRYKLAYFRSEGWLQSWIDVALDIIRREWDRYKPSSSGAASQSSSQGASLFAALDTYGTEGNVDALEDYLNTPPIPSVADPLKHWHALDSERNPLAHMALDMLSAPTTSVDTERSFPRGGLVVSKLRHNLSDESTRAATVLNSWMQIPGLVPKQSIVQNFKSKGSRSKGKVKVTPAAVDEVIDVDL